MKLKYTIYRDNDTWRPRKLVLEATTDCGFVVNRIRMFGFFAPKWFVRFRLARLKKRAEFYLSLWVR